MKKVTLSSLIFIMTTILTGQEIKISVAPTISIAPHYQSVLGGPGQKAKAGFSTSLDYILRNDKRISFGLGLSYQYSRVEFVPNLDSGDLLLHTEKVNLFLVSFRSVFNLKRNFYLSLDPSVDFHVNYNSEQTLDKQSGLGLSLAFGKSIKIKETILLNIEPRLWIHNIIPFQDDNLPYRLTTAGLNMGLVFGQKKDQLLEK